MELFSCAGKLSKLSFPNSIAWEAVIRPRQQTDAKQMAQEWQHEVTIQANLRLFYLSVL